jgi:hypothetical protein
MTLPSDFHSVLQAADFHGVPLGAAESDIRAELGDLEIERARASRQGRIASALPALRRAVETAFEASQPLRVTLPSLPSSASDMFVFCRQSGGQVGALHDPVARTFFDAYVAFIPAEEWSRLRAVTAHRTLDLIFVAAGPFENLRDLWSRAMNWSGVRASANSSLAPGELEGVIDRLVASVPDSLSAAWWRSGDVHLAQQIKSACQRVASRSDPEHHARWTPPWEQQSVEAAE